MLIEKQENHEFMLIKKQMLHRAGNKIKQENLKIRYLTYLCLPITINVSKTLQTIDYHHVKINFIKFIAY